VEEVTKAFHGSPALRGVSFEVAYGEIFALLGPNGAGKTTTVEIAEGFIAPDSGRVMVAGLDPIRDRSELRLKVGVVLQQSALERYLTVEETIRMYASWYPRPLHPEELLKLVGLYEEKTKRVIRLSGGQLRRLEMALALVGDPEIVFLDEPTTGFDPAARRTAWEAIRQLAALGKTIILTTHYLEEAAQLANRLAVLVAGQVVALDSPAGLISKKGRQARVSFRKPPGDDPPMVGEFFQLEGDRVEFWSRSVTLDLAVLTSWALSRGLELEELTVSRPSLEEVYLELVGAEGLAGAEEAVPATRSRRSRRR
jgi:ABC-2 type transport system ATP-binding protein